jgi:hypothetical protein
MSVEPTHGYPSTTALAAGRPVIVQYGREDLDTDLVEVVAAEQLLLTTPTTGDVEVIDRMLHQDFVEFGASGKTWDRGDIIRLLSAKPGSPGRAHDFRPIRLGPDAVLLTYGIDGVDRSSLCSSVWLRDGAGGWRLRFHQGTRTSS